MVPTLPPLPDLLKDESRPMASSVVDNEDSLGVGNVSMVLFKFSRTAGDVEKKSAAIDSAKPRSARSKSRLPEPLPLTTLSSAVSSSINNRLEVEFSGRLRMSKAD